MIIAINIFLPIILLAFVNSLLFINIAPTNSAIDKVKSITFPFAFFYHIVFIFFLLAYNKSYTFVFFIFLLQFNNTKANIPKKINSCHPYCFYAKRYFYLIWLIK